MFLDANYYSMYKWNKDYLERLPNDARPLWIALERGEREIKIFKTKIDSPLKKYENDEYVERIVKFMLWAFGGYKFYILGPSNMVSRLSKIYSTEGRRSFDYEFMTKVYGRPLEFVRIEEEKDFPKECEKPIAVERNSKGYKIGFDAGGSDRKVTATIDGEVVFESEDIWHPKLNADPAYHKAGIKDSIDKALKALGGRVDAIGVSSAGIVVDGEMRTASLFIKVPDEIYAEKVHRIYKDLEKEYGCPVKVANDGDVAALAGAFALNSGNVLGIAMGTSEAAGFVDEDFRIKGYLNELAFAPVDAFVDSARDDWSGDVGVGSQYHSQDGVIRLAKQAGIELDSKLSPAEKLKVVQKLAEEGDGRATSIFQRLGEYFGYSVLWYREFYPIEKILLLGRVASGIGGDILLAKAKQVLKAEKSGIEIVVPDERTRRLGQSYTATLM